MSRPLLSPVSRAIVAAACGALCIGWLHYLLGSLRGSPFVLEYVGMDFANLVEVYFVNYFLLFALPALGLFAYALERAGLADRLLAFAGRAAADRRTLPLLCLFVFAVSLLVRFVVLERAPTTQDESTYDFIADTLAAGRIVNPLPEDPSFFKNEFVVLNDRGWFGKYPIGHPLLLALGGLVKARALVVPALSALLVALTAALGRRLYGPAEGALAAGLLALSPQVLLTGGTLLSQPASAFFSTLGLLLLLRVESGGRARDAAAAGAAFGFAFLVRPLPGALFLPVVAIYLLSAARLPWRRRWLLGIVAALCAAPFGAAYFAVNAAQTGSPVKTGYHLDYREEQPLAVFEPDAGPDRTASAVGNAVMRLNLWQSGFPLLAALALLAGLDRRSALLAGMMMALVGYRLLVPKAGVVTTGPVYVYELLPWLAVLVAAGALAARELPGWRELLPPRRLAALLGAGFVVAATAFWPVQLRSLAAGANRHLVPYRLAEEQGIGRAVVFYEVRRYGTWARYLRNPRLDLSDEVLFLRRGRHTYAECAELARRRFPDRAPWVYLEIGGKSWLEPLAERVEKEARAGEAKVVKPPGPFRLPALEPD